MAALALLIRKITAYQGFAHYLKAGPAEVSDIALLDFLAQIAGQTGVNKPVGLYTNSLVSSPLLLGFFRPCIMLPTTDMPETDFRYTILHELTHYKRRDMFFNLNESEKQAWAAKASDDDKVTFLAVIFR